MFFRSDFLHICRIYTWYMFVEWASISSLCITYFLLLLSMNLSPLKIILILYYSELQMCSIWIGSLVTACIKTRNPEFWLFDVRGLQELVLFEKCFVYFHICIGFYEFLAIHLTHFKRIIALEIRSKYLLREKDKNKEQNM